MTTIQDRKTALEARAAALKARLGGIEAELISHDSQDWEDLATEREGDEVLEGMGLEAQAELRAIDAALARIASDDYGFCQKCGKPIPEARLDVLPFTPFCKECAA